SGETNPLFWRISDHLFFKHGALRTVPCYCPMERQICRFQTVENLRKQLNAFRISSQSSQIKNSNRRLRIPMSDTDRENRNSQRQILDWNTTESRESGHVFSNP